MRGVKGSTRLEAKRQRRRDGRDTTRRRAPILTEAEFLARREAVDRVMAVRQTGDRTQIAVLEDDILVEHYVTRASATSYVGNVYLGRVQNVLPIMEAAFIDIGKGRNGVLYAGEVNWDAAGLEGKSRAIESALKSGDAVLVQVTKDPIGHKGARLTSQISLPGRFLVYVPGGGMTGISRRLPDTERHRLKAILKKIVPEDAGVIVRTAAEGASEEDLTRDVERLHGAVGGDREARPSRRKAAPGPAARRARPRDPRRPRRLQRGLQVARRPGRRRLGDGLGLRRRRRARSRRAGRRKHAGNGDLFHDLRVDEQLMKALDRKVWLPSGGSLVIDRTEAMTVIDVNTGKFVGSGGNLEQTVTRNNLEAAEEIVRQLRLRDVGGIVVIDFIDMVLESQPRSRAAPAHRVPRPRPHQAPGRRGHLARAGADDPQAGRRGPARGVQRAVRALQRPRRDRPHRAGRQAAAAAAARPTTTTGPQAAASASAAAARRPARPSRRRAVEPPMTDEQRQAANAAIAAIHRRAPNGRGRRADGDRRWSRRRWPSELVAAARRRRAARRPVADARRRRADEPRRRRRRAEVRRGRRRRRRGRRAAADGADGRTPSRRPPTRPSRRPSRDARTARRGRPARRRRRAASRPAGPPGRRPAVQRAGVLPPLARRAVIWTTAHRAVGLILSSCSGPAARRYVRPARQFEEWIPRCTPSSRPAASSTRSPRAM